MTLTLKSLGVLTLVLTATPLATANPKVEAKAGETTFPSIVYTLKGGRIATASYGDFTQSGPKTDSLRPLPKGIKHVAFDPVAKQLYGISGHQVHLIDLERKTSKEMKLPDDVPELSWACGLAFDTKRERLVMVSFGGVGHMYSFTPKTSKWEVIAEMNYLDLCALTYDAKADRLFGLFASRRTDEPIVGEFDNKGALVGGTVFRHDSLLKEFATSPPETHAQLAPLGDRIAIITADRIFSLHRKTGKVDVTWKR